MNCRCEDITGQLIDNVFQAQLHIANGDPNSAEPLLKETCANLPTGAAPSGLSPIVAVLGCQMLYNMNSTDFVQAVQNTPWTTASGTQDGTYQQKIQNNIKILDDYLSYLLCT